MVKLFRAIVGVAGSVFSVDIDADQSVGDLKKLIMHEKTNDLKDVDAHKLQLFLAKKPTEGEADEDKSDVKEKWLTQLDVLKGVSDTNDYKELPFPGEKLRDVGLPSGQLGGVSGEYGAAGKGPVHVLVKLPAPHKPRDSQLVLDGVTIHVTTNMALNRPALVAFWKAFLVDPTEVKADAVIALPQGTFLLGD